MKSKLHIKQNGFVAIVAVVLIVIFGFMGLVALYLVNGSVLASNNNLLSAQAFYMAESGLEHAIHELVGTSFSNRSTCAGITGSANFTNISFSGSPGSFTVTANLQSPIASSLNGAITASATTITVFNASGYPGSGRIMIDKELMDYISISGNSFINVTRGVAGTAATAHASGAGVGQYQCYLNSQGGIPNLSNAKAKRSVQETVQLPEGWAAGTAASGVPIFHWNKPTELQWSTASFPSLNSNAFSLYILSYADAWIVGQNYLLLHWDGNSWNLAIPPSGTTRNLNGVVCTTSNNCWAVGNARSFLGWNGSSWAVQSVPDLPNVAYRSVDCVNASDCWAVGVASSGNVMVHWNGSAWSRDPSRPTPATTLNGVRCAASNDCWAVGVSRTFIHWNGSSWTTHAAAALPNVTFNGIDCSASSDCWAVGVSSGGRDVMAHWDGSAWSRDPSNPGSTTLNAVRCNSSSDCWAVGNNSATIHWDGTSWSAISNPGPGTIDLNAVGIIGYNTRPESAWQEVYP